jgi:hypothetical protein
VSRKLEVSDRIAIGSVVVALGSLAFAVVAQRESSSTSKDQQELQRQVEERASAPLLIPGVEPEQRLGKRRFQIAGSYKEVVKLANFLRIYWDPRKPSAEPYIVVPVRNVGEAIAIVLDEEARVVRDCQTVRGRRLNRRGVERLGFYVVRPGESEQLYFAPRGDDASVVAAEYKQASDALEVNVLVRYTDQLGQKIRWTCIGYTRGSEHDPRWSVAKPVYEERTNPRRGELVVTPD